MKKELWAEKYRVESLKEFKGQEDSIMKLKKFFISFESGGKKAAVLHGPAGSGKTSLVHALANDLGFEILEMNASSLRSREQVERVLNEASRQKSLFSKGKILLVDEVDGVSGREDRGGVQAIAELIEQSSFHIIMTANDIWDKKFSSIRQGSELIALKEIDYRAIEDILRNISRKEKAEVNDDIIKAIAVRSRGDVRAAMNDLQSIAGIKDVAVSSLYEREREESIFSAMQKVFKAAKIDFSLLEAFDNVNMTTDEVFLWLEENLPLEFKGAELASAFNALSLADVFRGRIIRRQHWRFLIYENVFMTAGIAASKKQVKLGFTPYKRPTRILKIWMSNQRTVRKKSICQKYAKATHRSVRRTLRDFSHIKFILEKNKALMHELKLNPEEIEYLREMGR